MAARGYISSASLLWLSQLLFERFGVRFSLASVEDGNIRISIYGSEHIIEVRADPFTFNRSDSDLPYARWDASSENWRYPIDPLVPAPGAASLPDPLIAPTKGGFTIRFDILGLTYWMLTRKEEMGRLDLDAHGRFPAAASHASKNGYLERPVVDEWMNVLRQVIQRTWPTLILKQPEFTVRVSHDVDAISLYHGLSLKKTIHVAAASAKNGRYRDLWLAPLIRIRGPSKLLRIDPANTFDWIMDISDEMSLKSAFYFICGRSDRTRDATYDVHQPTLRRLMRRIHKRGHEIGLHPSYNTVENPSLIASEFSTLRRVCAEEGISQSEWGGRMHYLRWRQTTTLQAWDDAGIDYDSTLGYADRAGFRCGTCFEYPAFNIVTQRTLKLRIRPLVAMDVSILSPRYMGLVDYHTALSKFRQLRQLCSLVGGSFTTLWHNTHLITSRDRNIYESLIKNNA